jgi:FkbM family methyltransferase
MLSAVRLLLNKLGYHIDKIDRSSSTMAGGIMRMSAHTPIATFIDVGASDGRWAAMAMLYYPDASYLLIEAQKGHQADLDNFVNKHEKVIVEMAAASDTEGEVYFDTTDLHGGLASKDELETKNQERIKSIRIDKVVDRHDLHAPFALKLDTHGFEVPIFEGASGILAQTNLIIVEAYNFRIANGALKFYEMCIYLEEKGFFCADLVDIMRRPKDNFLWQMDLFFLRKSRTEFTVNKYQY